MSLLYGPAVSIPSTSPTSPSPSPSTPSSFLSTFIASRSLSQTSSTSSLPSETSSRTPSQSSFNSRTLSQSSFNSRTPSQSSFNSQSSCSRTNLPRFQASSLSAFQESQPAPTAREPETVSYRFNNETDVYILPCLSMGDKYRSPGQQVDMAGARRNEERNGAKDKKKGWKHRAFWR